MSIAPWQSERAPRRRTMAPITASAVSTSPTIVPTGAPLARRRRRGRFIPRDMRITNLCGCYVRNDTDHIANGFRDSATSNFFGGMSAINCHLSHLVGAHDSATTDFLCGASDLFTVGLPVRTVRSVADDVTYALREFRMRS